MKTMVFSVLVALLMALCACNPNNRAVYGSDAFSLYPDRVVQDSFVARALSPYEMSSGYSSAEFQKYNPTVEFKLSINSHDNELPFGKNHVLTLKPVNGLVETTIVFGQQLQQKSGDAMYDNLPENTPWHIKVDMRKVFEAFGKDGFYTLYDGEVLTKTDFKALYIAGSGAPLSWDFSNLYTRADMQLKDDDGDGIYEITLLMNSRKDEKKLSHNWKLSKDISELPAYSSDYVLSDAVYNLSLEEMLMAVEADSTFRTGKEWAGVWTRDISYSILLSMAYMQPKVAEYSLRRKVKNDRIVQDTGSGGAYPVSTDRIIWAVAAWEVYKATGDAGWLNYAYRVIKNTIADDMENAFDPETGLMRGESSFLDWREQTYPHWMQPADIYQSMNLGTNAAHYQANVIAAQMATILSDKTSAQLFAKQAEIIKNAIQKYLWINEKNYHGQYLYGRSYMSLSPRAETLGEALTILFDINTGEQAAKTVANFPVTPFGVSCIYPQIPGIPPYHNNGIWPFVQSYWALAAAKAGNEQAVMAQLAAIYRASAMFLTNKENYVAETGDFAGTQVNSSVMLWSLSGNLALVHRLLFGIGLQPDKLEFRPFVPEALKGKRTLTNFRYRNAVLHIEMEGYGNEIKEFQVDGKESKPEIPAGLTGNISVKIVLADKINGSSGIHHVLVDFTPATPIAQLSANTLCWDPVNNAAQYIVYKNGNRMQQTGNNSLLLNTDSAAEYQVLALDKNGISSFLSAPVRAGVSAVYSFKSGRKVQPTAVSTGFVTVSRTECTKLALNVDIPADGMYALKIRYANGNGPVNTENKCAFRAFYIDAQKAGTFVFPQRGSNEWQNTGFSNVLKSRLESGKHVFEIVFELSNENMNGDVNEARLFEVYIEKAE